MENNLRLEKTALQYRNWDNSFRKKKKEKTDGTEFMDAFLRKLPEDPVAAKAEGGVFTHENGTVFGVDTLRRTITLGDVSSGQKVLRVRLSTGYLLQVSWEKLGDLASCFDAFRPEDVERIMRAIASENHRESSELDREQKAFETYEGLLGGDKKALS